VILLDTSGLYAALYPGQPQHGVTIEILTGEVTPLAISPFVLAELDYLVASRRGVEKELKLLNELSGGAYELAAFDIDDVRTATSVISRYRDLGIGLTDASLVVLADRYRTERILTLDERHFRALRSLRGRPFELLPADG
jgi:predicted nucleic acid-binding protein